jgi:hypothetical protein
VNVREWSAMFVQPRPRSTETQQCFLIIGLWTLTQRIDYRMAITNCLRTAKRLDSGETADDFSHAQNQLTPDIEYAVKYESLRNHSDRPQPRFYQLRPSRYRKLRAPQPERMPALRIQMHLDGNLSVLHLAAKT